MGVICIKKGVISIGVPGRDKDEFFLKSKWMNFREEIDDCITS
jgi:hypothetical protein